jgi:hypothetical protein
MSGRFPIMRSLDPHHQRVGYLGALALHTTRGLNNSDSILRKLKEVLFERIYMDDPRFQPVFDKLSSKRHAKLVKLSSERKLEDNPAAILQPAGKASKWVYTSELWLHADCMPAPLGLVIPKKVSRIFDLAKWVNILTPTIELSEAGYLLKILLEEEKAKDDTFLFNPLCPSPRPAVKLMYLRLLLAADGLWSFIIRKMVLTDNDKTLRTYSYKDKDGLLKSALDAHRESLGKNLYPEDLIEIKDISNLRDSIAKNKSTEENYLRPRMELLVDLDLIQRNISSSSRLGAFPWSVTPKTKRAAEVLVDLGADHEPIGKYLDKKFFGSMAYVYGVKKTPISDNRLVLRWFAIAFERVGRDHGFTPGRSVALLACLLAFEANRILEVEQIFDTVYASAKSEWGSFLRFSGGSRFDREFMILVDKKFIAALEESLATTPEQL